MPPFSDIPDPVRRPREHLRAVLLAFALMMTASLAALFVAHSVEKRGLHAVAPEISDQKNLGIVWQHAVFAEPSLLSLYGSSELTRHFGNEPQRFFAGSPTGFAVSPVGRDGCTSLILAEKIGATAGGLPPDRKVAICLSPSWFFEAGGARARWYAGNFSTAQAGALLAGGGLSRELKRDFARRMLDYPSTLDHAPLFAFALRRLTGGRWTDRVLLAAAMPLVRLQNALTEFSDHLALAQHILRSGHSENWPARSGQGLDWAAILANGKRDASFPRDTKSDASLARVANNRTFVRLLEGSQEWGDLELLLRATRELHLQPIILSIPIDEAYYQRLGLTRESLDHYHVRLRALTQQYDVALVDFSEHEKDGSFFADHHDHLSALGWLYFDRVLDFYYHSDVRQRFFPTGDPAESYP